MLHKSNRLSASRDVVHVLRRGRLCPNRYWTLKWLPNGLEQPRFAFIVSNKISKRATIRNTIKRRLRQAVRQCGIGKVPNADIILIAKISLVNTPSSVIRDELMGQLQACFRQIRSKSL